MINLKLWRIPALLMAGGIAFTSCSEPDALGIEVQPKGDQPGVFFTDTITISAQTIDEDSIRSDETVAQFNLVGSYTDPVFGLSRASFYSQIRLPNNNTNFTFGTSPTLDSVVLTLNYADYYGDTLTPLQIEVYKLDGSLLIESTYYSDDVLPVITPALFSGVIEARPKDSVEVDGIKRAPHLRLKIDQAFGTDFINSSTSNFLDNTSFTNYFKGIWVRAADVTTPGQGSILSFNLLSSMSKLTFYYKNGSDTTRRSANFEINSECPRFNHFEHDYTSSTFGTTFPIPGQDTLYIQSMSGTKVRLSFPYIRNLGGGDPVSINKAELVIPAANNGAPYTNNSGLIVFGVDSNGGEAIIPDLLETTSYYGGTYSGTTGDFRFNLARYVQQLISGKIVNDYGLSLVASSGSFNAQRTIIPGTSAPGTKIQLRLTYSKLQ